MKVTPAILEQVHKENLSNHQIGGETDGMSLEVAEDLGFISLNRAIEIHEVTEAQSVPKPLTSAQQNANARSYVAEHLKRVNKQVIDPNYG